jgi:hypothetical protein
MVDGETHDLGRNWRDRARFYSHQENDFRNYHDELQTSAFRPTSPGLEQKNSEDGEVHSNNSDDQKDNWESQSDQSEG